MLKSRRILGFLAGCLIVVGSTGAMARSRTSTPHRFQAASDDRQLIQTTNPVDGRTWAAWSYRSGAQYDLALAVQGELGRWSEPVFQGSGDGIDQVDPAFAVHASGLLVVAFAEPERGRILISTLAPGSNSWTRPVPVASGDDLHAPSMLVLGDRLVVAYRSAEQVRILDIPIGGSSIAGTLGFTDGPDTTGNRDDEDQDDSDKDDDDPTDGVSKTGMVPIIDTSTSNH